eukprot:5965628-Prymnesium_polylepis.1
MARHGCARGPLPAVAARRRVPHAATCDRRGAQPLASSALFGCARVLSAGGCSGSLHDAWPVVPRGSRLVDGRRCGRAAAAGGGECMAAAGRAVCHDGVDRTRRHTPAAEGGRVGVARPRSAPRAVR